MAILAAVLLFPVVVAASLHWWAVHLVRRTAAPRWVLWVIPAIVAVGVVGAVVGALPAFRAMGAVTPDQKQALLSASISEGMNTAAFFCFPLVPLWVVVLVYFALRRPTKGSA